MPEAGSPPTELEALFAAAAAPTPTWAASVAALSMPTRRQLLARADASWSEDVGVRTRACRVYRALHADLDPTTPAGCVRIRRLLDEGGVMRLEALMERTERTAVEPDLRHFASLVLGQWDLVRGDLAGCEARYRAALDAGRGRWPALLGAAYNNYARLCLEQRRDLEALVLARRGAETCLAAGDALGAVYAELVEAYVLAGLEDWPRARDACRRIRSALPTVPPVQHASIGYGLHGVLADLAIGEGRPADAFCEAERAAELARAHREPSWSPRESDLIAAQAWAAMGRRDQALEAIARGLAAGPVDDAIGLHLQTWQVRLEAELGLPTLGLVAVSWLDTLEGPAGLALGAGVRLVYAQRGAEALAASGCGHDEARRAFRVAAGAALARLAEMQHFAREFPEASRPSPAEAAILDDYRRRTEARERALRAAVSQLLVEEIRAGRWPLHTLAAVGDLVCCCAWCACVRTQDGRWSPLPETLHRLPSDTVPLTHGICPACLPGLASTLDDA